MATYPSIDPRFERQQDEQHLRYLAVANYIYAAFNALGVLAGIGILLFISGIVATQGTRMDPEAIPVLGFVGSALGFLIVLVPSLFTILHLVFARALQTRRYYTFCMVMAIFTCLSVPIGTVLGILVLVVLMRPSVQQIFEEENWRLGRQNYQTMPQEPHRGTA